MALNQSIERFPVEIIQEILLHMPSLKTLKSAILTGPTFYRAFRGLKHKILPAVLKTDLGLDLLELALGCELAGRRLFRDQLEIDEFLKDHVGKGKQSIRAFESLQKSGQVQINSMIQFLNLVDWVVSRFLNSRLKSTPVAQKGMMPDQLLSPTEVLRIRRSLYRLELQHNLDRCPGYSECEFVDPPKAERSESFQL